MKVYKFGGASVRSAAGVRNLAHIVGDVRGGLFVIVSAMGKTTNALEAVVDEFMAGRRDEALRLFDESAAYHDGIIAELFGGATSGVSAIVAPAKTPAAVRELYDEVREILRTAAPTEGAFERWYDTIVGYGELLSTTIISEYLNAVGTPNKWVDMRRFIVTDERFKYANVDVETSTGKLREVVAENPDVEVFVGQGFIGATPDGQTTTLGREGSDYSAALVASMLDAESVSIWKDVSGVLSADPKIFPDAEFIPELSYLDAIELAFSGAQIIHPKTIKPLQNKHIPLYVRPFGDKDATGSAIKAEIAASVDVPILILKRDQVLLSIRPHDYSFVLEEKLGEIFATLERFNVKINLVQTSAVNMSLSIDRTRRMDELVEALRAGGFFVKYNDGMELLTVRGYTPREIALYNRPDDGSVYLAQRTRKVLRLVRKDFSRYDQ